jgi:acyl transferase domain-containing protein
MTALEATGTDPQQRLMLEVAYEALENGEKMPTKTTVASAQQSFPSWNTNP